MTDFCNGYRNEIYKDNQIIDYEYTGYIIGIANCEYAVCYVSLWDACDNFEHNNPIIKSANGIAFFAKIHCITNHGVNYAIGKLKYIINVIEINHLTEKLKNANGDICTIENGLYSSYKNTPTIIRKNGTCEYYYKGIKLEKQKKIKYLKCDVLHVGDAILNKESPKSFVEIVINKKFCKVIGCKNICTHC
jgi:hypothetical protein